MELNCYYDGSDYVIAYSVEDAINVWEEFNGPGAVHESREDPDYEWELVGRDEIFTASLIEDPNHIATHTVEGWINRLGRRWFCTEN